MTPIYTDAVQLSVQLVLSDATVLTAILVPINIKYRFVESSKNYALCNTVIRKDLRHKSLISSNIKAATYYLSLQFLED